MGGKEVGYLSREGREKPDELPPLLLLEGEEDWAGAEKDRLGAGLEKDRLGAGDGAGAENDLLGAGLEKDLGAGAACGADGTLEGAWKLGYEGACLAGAEN